MNHRSFFVLAAIPALAGCWVVLGESFSGYAVAPSDASAESSGDGAIDGAMMGNCTPACMGDHVVCDPADNTCKLDGTTTNVGAACIADGTCGSASNANAKCFDQANYDYPGGYCTVAMCSPTAPCPLGATCATLGGGSNACYKNCDNANGCRSPDYECLDISPLYMTMSIANAKVCVPKALGCYIGNNCPTVKPTCTADGGPGFCM